MMADVVLSTAHKAKGLEFDTVRLTEDYLASDGMRNWRVWPSSLCIYFSRNFRTSLKLFTATAVVLE